jgi:hypothetical protein
MTAGSIQFLPKLLSVTFCTWILTTPQAVKVAVIAAKANGATKQQAAKFAAEVAAAHVEHNGGSSAGTWNTPSAHTLAQIHLPRSIHFLTHTQFGDSLCALCVIHAWNPTTSCSYFWGGCGQGSRCHPRCGWSRRGDRCRQACREEWRDRDCLERYCRNRHQASWWDL